MSQRPNVRGRRDVVAVVLAVARERVAQRLPLDAVVVAELAAVGDEAADGVVLGAVGGGGLLDGVAAAEPVVLPLEAALDEPGEDPFGLGGELRAELLVFAAGEGDLERDQPDAVPDRAVASRRPSA